MATTSAPAWASAPAVIANGYANGVLVRKTYVRQGGMWYTLAARGYLISLGKDFATMATLNPVPTTAPVVKPRPAGAWANPNPPVWG